MTVRIRGVSYAYPHQSALIDIDELNLSAGWTGVVGVNGSGKTTLLRLIAGELCPLTGTIEPQNAFVEHCRQIPDRQQAEAFALSWTPESCRWLSRLGLEPEWVHRWSSLSPGERRRFQLAAALGRRPDVLLLDEPTNHLDDAGRTLLLNVLARFDGVGIVVSHDRAFLDALCSRTVRIDRHQVSSYAGGYSIAREAWRAEAAAMQSHLDDAQANVRQMRAALHRVSARHQAADRGRSTASRMSSVRDSDARSTARKGRVAGAEAKLGRAKHVAAKQLRSAEASVATLRRPAKSTGAVSFSGGQHHAAWLLHETIAALQVDGRILAREVELRVGRTSRLWLVGPNGSGKSVLIDELLRRIRLDAQHLLYLPQSAPPTARLRSAFCSLPRDERSVTVRWGARLGLDAAAWSVERVMSPGERRKATVALGLSRDPHLIVMDEPTNDLDLDSVERLESALREYGGAVVLVTHDTMFAERVGVTPWRIEWSGVDG